MVVHRKKHNEKFICTQNHFNEQVGIELLNYAELEKKLKF